MQVGAAPEAPEKPPVIDSTLPATLHPLAVLVGCLLMGGIFVQAGIDHFRRFDAVSAMLRSRNWPFPGPVLALASAFQIAAGLGLALGVQRPLAALGLAVFTVVASVTLVDFWRHTGPERESQRAIFLVNCGLTGGLLLAAGLGI